MTKTRSEDAQLDDLAVHSSGEVVILCSRDTTARTGPGWYTRNFEGVSHGIADTVLDGDDWTIVTLDQVRAMAAAIRAGVKA